jgi:hypothetical protein
MPSPGAPHRVAGLFELLTKKGDDVTNEEEGSAGNGDSDRLLTKQDDDGASDGGGDDAADDAANSQSAGTNDAEVPSEPCATLVKSWAFERTKQVKPRGG